MIMIWLQISPHISITLTQILESNNLIILSSVFIKNNKHILFYFYNTNKFNQFNITLLKIVHLL